MKKHKESCHHKYDNDTLPSDVRCRCICACPTIPEKEDECPLKGRMGECSVDGICFHNRNNSVGAKNAHSENESCGCYPNNNIICSKHSSEKVWNDAVEEPIKDAIAEFEKGGWHITDIEKSRKFIEKVKLHLKI